MSGQPGSTRALQMRLIVRAEDYEDAVKFYRDILGAGEELQIHSPDGENVTILDVGRATQKFPIRSRSTSSTVSRSADLSARICESRSK